GGDHGGPAEADHDRGTELAHTCSLAGTTLVPASPSTRRCRPACLLPWDSTSCVATMTALMVWNRFSAWSNTIDRGDSNTSSVTSRSCDCPGRRQGGGNEGRALPSIPTQSVA